jgi:hypothetical protein
MPPLPPPMLRTFPSRFNPSPSLPSLPSQIITLPPSSPLKLAAALGNAGRTVSLFAFVSMPGRALTGALAGAMIVPIPCPGALIETDSDTDPRFPILVETD